MRGSYETEICNIVNKLREGPKSFSELEKKLKIPKKSLQRYLNALKTAEVIIKDSDGRYYLAEYRKPVQNMTELELKYRVEHSTMIVLGGLLTYINKMLPDIKLKGTSIAYSQLMERQGKTYVPDPNIERYLENHLRTGYPDIFQMIYQKPTQQSDVEKLDRSLQDVIYSLMSGEPLRGGCETCPAIRIEKVEKELSKNEI